MVWLNGFLKVYHGTTDANALAVKTGPDPSFGRAVADFGKGFYVTSDRHQAEQWANQRAKSDPRGIARAAVVYFEIDRDALSKFGDHLVFSLPDQEFYDFVLFNRLGGANHHRLPPNISYSVVYGPVAAYPQTIAFANCMQICIVADGKLKTAADVTNSGIFGSNRTINYPLSPAKYF